MDFLIVESDFPFWRGYVFDAWKRLPHRTLLVSRVPKMWRSGDFDEVRELPLRDGALDVDGLVELTRGFGEIAGACTMFEPAVGQTLEIQRALGLPQLAESDARNLRNKAAMVEAVGAAGLAVPRTVYATDADELASAALAELAFPMIVKPSELAGSAGVRLAHDEAALREAVPAALAETLPFEVDGQASSVVAIFGCDRGALVQEYVEGPELSIEGYASRGVIVVLAVTEKIHSGPPLFEELGHLQPPRLETARCREIEEYAVAVGRALGLRNTFFHLEVRWRERGPVLIEINCRLSGDMIGRLLEMRSSLNVSDLLLRIAAGEAVPGPERWHGAAGVRMATVEIGGTVTGLRPPLLRSERETAVFDVAPGASVHSPLDGGVTRVGYYLVAADEPDQVSTRLDELAAQTRVEIGSPRSE